MMQLYKFFKQARDEQPAQPSFYQMEVCVCCLRILQRIYMLTGW